MEFIDNLNFDDKGLIPAIVQDSATGQVLTLCYMNKEALEKTMDEKKIYVFRRSKARVMVKGERSGCVQLVKDVFVDCADNSVLFKVEQTRAACHEGYFSCYYRKVDENGGLTVVSERVFDPKEVY
ncbi:MAG: phosphoribosyl-AMP cyclohydrolase [Candidatus Omnitrophica bacterium]|nr:phosphoribosyl-AMP cyclohydrolase [Candidatus Omnitrophota bacterium]MBU1128647.1 phosphoribosyl-AMP cyclohydrolase [Candidatus Omnitrophota bacterium]MBU1785028.1 phosphoribosyl-AMP cyclohydrolase [Candidatus Omnitrophota bacterium]MBU1852223.1 phosphoribosyl-AMP cyclohydrolase [Candidatus Omnitrophota bacterium]